MSELALKGDLIGQGNTAEVFEWEDKGVLKLYRNGIPEIACTNEFTITQYAYEHMKIAPKPIEIIHSNERIGAVYERLNGKTLLKMMVAKPWKLRKYSKMLAQCHMKMHTKASLSVRTVKEKLLDDIKRVSILSLEEKRLIIAYVDTLSDGDCICHFDFHPDNVIIQNDQYYVIDWMTGCIGNPLSDVARTVILLTYAKMPRAPFLVNAIIKAMQKRICKYYLSEYKKLTNYNFSEMEKWKLPIAAARLSEWIPEGESRQLLDYVKQELSRMERKA